MLPLRLRVRLLYQLPPQDWFRHYAQTFDTVEINNSFYHRAAFAYFNNDVEAHAVFDAQTLRAELSHVS